MRVPFSLRTSASIFAVAALMPNLVFTLQPAGTNLTVSISYTETDDSGDVISPGMAWLSVTGWTGWDSSTTAISGTEYVPALNEIEYYWEVSHATADFSARAGIGLPTSPAVFNDCSKQRGPRVCIPLPEAGAYTYTLFAYEPSSGKTYNSGSVALTTTVSEDSAFPTTRTICYSVDNIFTGAPTGSNNVTSLAALQTAVTNAITAGDTFRILLRKGEVYTGANMNMGSTWTTSFPNFRTGTYGTGNDPKVTAPFSGSFFIFPSGSGAKHCWMGPIWWEGRWDAVNERGNPNDGSFPAFVGNAIGTCVFYGVKTTGLQIGLGGPTTDNIDMAYVNCEVTHFQSNGGSAYTIGANTAARIAFIGCFWGWPSGAVTGGDDRLGTGEYINLLCNGATGAGWGMRLGDWNVVIVQHCYWHAANSGSQGTGQTQPALRSNGTDVVGAIWSIAHNVWEGGVSTGVGGIGGPYNATFDANLFLTGQGGDVYMAAPSKGIVVRNNHFFCGHTKPSQTPTSVDGPLPLSVPVSYTSPNSLAPIILYNNTHYDRVSRFKAGWSFNAGNLNTEVNNFIASGAAPSSLTVSVISGFTPKYQGLKKGFPVVPITLGTDWTDGGATDTFDIPYTNALLDELDGTATNQTYWNATIAAGDTFHMIKLADNSVLLADDGDFTVTTTATGLRFTNTSGGTITAQNISVKVDRASELVADTQFGTAVQGAVAILVPNGGYTWSTGLLSYKDFQNTDRGDPAYQGAVEA